MGIRRELTSALQKVDNARATEGRGDANLAEDIRIQIIQTGIFAAALRVVEYFRPDLQPDAEAQRPSDPATHSSTTPPSPDDPRLTHGLSRAAHDAVVNKKSAHPLSPLLSGPLAAVSFPTVSTLHLKAVLSILAPSAASFPAPSRRANPGYYDLMVQSGLQKLLLLGARVEGKVFDVEGTKWVGGIEGGIDGLRGQLVAMLPSVGAGVTNTLESAGRSLYFTVEGRRGMLEDEAKGPDEKEKES
jgi:large subunit ribosomal protein L10